MADYRSTSEQTSQQNLLEALKAIQNSGQFQQQLAQQRQMPQIQEQAKQQGETDRLNQLMSLFGGKVPANAGVSLGPEGAAITRPASTGMVDLRKEEMDEKKREFEERQATQKDNKENSQAENYSKRLEKYSDLTGAYADLERITNRDGSGGIFTNPNATLLSTGKGLSALPDKAIGLGEAIGAIPKGAAEERKAITRIQQGVGVALGGARGMSPGVQAGIKNATGMMSSGDPALASKGLRAMARLTGGQIQIVQSGFSPDVRDRAHTNADISDPMDFFKSVTPESGPASNYKSPPAGNDQQVRQGLPKPQSQAAPVAPSNDGFDPNWIK